MSSLQHLLSITCLLIIIIILLEIKDKLLAFFAMRKQQTANRLLQRQKPYYKPFSSKPSFFYSLQFQRLVGAKVNGISHVMFFFVSPVSVVGTLHPLPDRNKLIYIFRAFQL